MFLERTQRQILGEILNWIPPHPAAHGLTLWYRRLEQGTVELPKT